MESKVPDNFHLDFPARMSDGRQFTDYRPNCLINTPNNIMNSHQYKQQLIHNTDNILTNEDMVYNTLMGCNKCSDYNIVPPNLKLTCNKDNCNTFVNNNHGLGTQIDYKYQY